MIRKLTTIFLFTILSQNLFAHKLKCEIFDLALGDNLIETPLIDIEISDFKQAKPYKINLNYELISAEFTFQMVSDNDLLFHIQTQEVVNFEQAQFKISISNLVPNKLNELGRVYTELTGIGDNTASICYLLRE